MQSAVVGKAVVGAGVGAGGATISTVVTVLPPSVVCDSVVVAMPGPDTVTSYVVLACRPAKCAPYAFCAGPLPPSIKRTPTSAPLSRRVTVAPSSVAKLTPPLL